MTPLSERDFQRQVVELAELYGWEWMHPRAGRTVDSWRTPMSGTMAKGWPDLVLLHPGRRQMIFVELKRDGAKLTEDQVRVRRVLQSMMFGGDPFDPSIEVVCWRPKDWADIEETLRRREAA